MALPKIFTDTFVFVWDFFLTLSNIVMPNLKAGHVVPSGHPGAGGQWPEYVPPGENDSRSACPMLNALANHGILPHDGKNIPFKTMNETVRSTYNFAPSFCYFVPNYIARILKKDYSKDTFDLAEISLHNGIEHDASLTREDTFHQPDQGKPHIPFIEELLGSASGKDSKAKHGAEDSNDVVLLTSDDLARYSAKRRTEAKARNPEFSLSEFHKAFGSSNSATLLRIFGGRVSDLRPFLIEERIPNGWEPSVRSRIGLTMAVFNLTVLPLEASTGRYIKELTKKSSNVQETTRVGNYGATGMTEANT
ncbi:putative chloroperoxidase [Lentinula detonsa]|uniref:Chloroperoxidase n=1 Tax=Lentinula detonsa TaxID=2804962 RepID=A0AA38PZH3_9AGAR|nr:putative chloroperoxidase [Lentinula detonsa]